MTRCLFFTFLLATTTLAAQTTPVEIKAEPHHHQALENAYVRIFKVDVEPGQATLMHVHHHDYVYVMLGASEIVNQVEGKAAVSVKLQDGETGFRDDKFAHLVTVTGSRPFRNVTIELLQDENEKARNTPPAKWDEERALHILDGGTEDVMFVKDGARVSETELRPGGMNPKHRHPGPHLLVAITDLNLHSEVPGKGASRIELKAGDVQWFPAGLTHSVMNMGQQPAKFVVVEFH